MDVNGITARAKDNAAGAYAFAQRQVDRVVSPDARQRAYTSTSDFAAARPLFFAFVVAQLLFSSLPLLIFASFVVSTAAFALGAAAIFALFWVGVALLVLVPTLFATFAVGVLVWAWAVGSFVVGRWMYRLMPAGWQASIGVDASTSTLPRTNGMSEPPIKHEDAASE